MSFNPDDLKYLTPDERKGFDFLLTIANPNRQGLMEFVPSLNRKYKSPFHLAPLVEALEASWSSSVRYTCCAPPRHGKTETLLAFIVQTLLRHPNKTIAYVTYEASMAESKSAKARMWAEHNVGLKLSSVNTKGEWRTNEGGGLLATGIGGPLTGHGVDIMIIDDPYKNRVAAESHAWRQQVTDWWQDVAETRLEPGGSAFVTHTRWHTDDLIAMLSGEPWEHILLPALNDDDEALWPDRFSVEELIKKRQAVGEYTWASLYQGQPRPRSGQLFQGVKTYTELPSRYEAAIGVDLAYTAKTQADHSVAVVLVESDATWYVKDVIRKQVRVDSFADDLIKLQKQYPGSTTRWYTSTTEQGSGDLLRKMGVNIFPTIAKADKFIRAQPVAAAWNNGKVLLPAKAEWLEPFVRVLTTFTGNNDSEDDDVDALAAAFDLLPANPFTKPGPKYGSPEWAKAESAKMMELARSRAEQRNNNANGNDPFGDIFGRQ